MFTAQGARRAASALALALLTAGLTPCARSAIAAQPARPVLEVTTSARGVSVYAISADAQELFTTLADKTHLQIIVDDTVKRQITVNLENLKPEDALNAIVEASGFSSAFIKGVWMISEGIPSGPSSYLLSDIASIRTRYVDAADAKALLPVFLQDYVKVDPEHNAVVLSAPAPVLDKFRKDIAQFDIPATQILFDVLMVEINSSHLDDLNLGLAGVDPANPQPNLLWNNAGKGFSLVSGLGQLTFDGIGSLTTQFNATLQALIQDGDARIRANPSIATVSGQTASVFIGIQRYISTPVQGSGNSIQAGVNLSVTPLTGASGVIFATLQTEVSTLGTDDPTTHLPDKSTRQANTTVTVKDGQTIVLGGLTQDELHETRTKIPILGDIPIIGQVFRTHSINRTHDQLLIFITPHVLTETGHLPGGDHAPGPMMRMPGMPGEDPPAPGKAANPQANSGSVPVVPAPQASGKPTPSVASPVPPADPRSASASPSPGGPAIGQPASRDMQPPVSRPFP